VEKVGAYTERATAEGEWRPGDPATGQQATPMLAQYFNMLQRELLAVLSAGGVVPDINTENQVLASIQRLAGRGVTTVTSADSPKALTVAEAGLVLVDASAGAVTLNLPEAGSNGGLRYTVLRMDSSANVVTVSPDGTAPDTIEGGSSLAIGTGQRRVLASAGSTDWKEPAGVTPRDMPLRGVQVYDSAGSYTWTVPPGVTRAWVTVIGGGGGGGNHSSTGGGGGGGGGFSQKLVDLTGVGSVEITVGSGGAGAPASTSNTNGSGGGTSSFGAFCSATGGGGANNWLGGRSGTGQGGDINTGLGPGGCGTYVRDGSSTDGNPGEGGGPGAVASGSGSDGVGGPNATLSGGGGGGGTTRGGGGNGAAGAVFIEW